MTLRLALGGPAHAHIIDDQGKPTVDVREAVYDDEGNATPGNRVTYLAAEFRWHKLGHLLLIPVWVPGDIEDRHAWATEWLSQVPEATVAEVAIPG